MPSRVVRGDLLESDRWLSLAHPVERLAYLVLLLVADDLGTTDATDGRLVRLWRDVCNLKGREDVLKVLAALVDADLVRTYVVDGKRYAFVPRFRQRFRAWSIRRPIPPPELLTDEPEITKNIRQINKREQKLPDSSRAVVSQMSDSCQSLAPVVVVGDVVVVEDVVKESQKKILSAQVERFAPPDWISADLWGGWIEIRKKLRAPNTHRALSLNVKRLDRLKSEGEDPAAVLEQSIERGWRGLFPVRADGFPPSTTATRPARQKICAECKATRAASWVQTQRGDVCMSCYNRS